MIYGSNCLDEKKRLRKEILFVRNSMSTKNRIEKSGKILKSVYDMEAYKKADVILAYADYQSEVITEPLIIKALTEGKKVFCPKVTDGDMEFYRITDMGELEEGYKGIREPAAGQPFMDGDEKDFILMLMPGVVFDGACHRIGYGKGFYDKYMTQVSEKGLELYAAALCFECQMVRRVPYEAHDIMPDVVITEEKIYYR